MIRKNKKNYVKLPESELTIMQLIWELDRKGVKDINAKTIVDTYPHVVGHLAITTILTLTTRLQDKGFIRLEKHGRSNCAVVLADENEYKHHAAADFVATVFKNDTRGMICALYSDGILSDEDIADLRRGLAAEDADK